MARSSRAAPERSPVRQKIVFCRPSTGDNQRWLVFFQRCSCCGRRRTAYVPHEESMVVDVTYPVGGIRRSYFFGIQTLFDWVMSAMMYGLHTLERLRELRIEVQETTITPNCSRGTSRATRAAVQSDLCIESQSFGKGAHGTGPSVVLVCRGMNWQNQCSPRAVRRESSTSTGT
jgi:hypothetical protein